MTQLQLVRVPGFRLFGPNGKAAFGLYRVIKETSIKDIKTCLVENRDRKSVV